MKAARAANAKIQRSLARLFTLGFVFACVLAGLSAQQYQQLNTERLWADHTHQVLTELDMVAINLLGAESSQRNFLLTRQSAYLTQYRSGIDATNQTLQRIAALTMDNAAQQATLAQLRRDIGQRLTRLDAQIPMLETRGLAAVQAHAATGLGRQLMAEIGSLTQTLRAREQALLQERIERRNIAAWRVGLLIAIGLIGYLLLLLIAYRAIRRMLQERLRAQEAEFRARELAEVTLHAIGDGVLITDANGIVTDVNRVAEIILGRARAQLCGLRADQALPLVNRHTRQPIVNPADDALRQRQIVMLDPDAVLIRDDGTEIGIEDSAAPIRDTQGNAIGAVLVFRDVTERRSLADQIAQLALYDPLTGLANRHLLEDRLRQAIEQAAREGDKVGLIFMDLDRFKSTNDSLGHAAGDALLKEVAARLTRTLRAGDTAARLGGDEFIALLPKLSTHEAAQQVAAKLLAEEQPPMTINGQSVPIQFSMGVAVYPKDAADGGALLHAADRRMYEHKQQRR